MTGIACYPETHVSSWQPEESHSSLVVYPIAILHGTAGYADWQHLSVSPAKSGLDMGTAFWILRPMDGCGDQTGVEVI